MIDPPEEPGPGIRSVGTTNWQGCLTATRHLIELGHRRIAIIGGPEHLWSSRARLAGLPRRAGGGRAGGGRAGRARGAHPPGSLLRRGWRQARELLHLPQPPTAIVAGNHAQAFGVLQALGERGLRAPGDLSVVGFDDVPVASWATPALTTASSAAMAATAFRMLRAPGTGPPGGFRDRGAAPHRAGHHPGDQGEHRAAGQGYINVIPDV